jgi:ubiquinone biosynthesis monooxygenase Coq7
MVAQEAEHFEQFDQLLRDRQVRPTLLSPFWHVAGFALGAGTALLGKNAAMVCTAAVEEAIDEHYRGQVEYLGEDEPELRETILAANADEIEHRDTARAEGANSSGAYAPLSTAIKAGTKLAIWFSERV